MVDEIDYTKYTMDQLRDAQRNIDRDSYPERADQIDLLIRDRKARQTPPPVTPGPTAPQAVTPPREPSPPGSAISKTSNKKIMIVMLSVFGGLTVLAVIVVLVVKALLGGSGITSSFDNQFGDQHLKTAVALIELHHVRYGEYPEDLSDLKYTGQWDQIHIQAVSYCASEDRSRYFIDVSRGWIGKPNLELEDEFWAGTGFDPDLGPCS